MSEIEGDIILEEGENSFTDIIENQLYIISTLLELEVDAYDAFAEDRIKAISQAMRIIHKCQKELISQI